MERTIQYMCITPNKYSRPQRKLVGKKALVIHYVGNTGSTAIGNRNYFEDLPNINLRNKTETYASAHFVVGLKGEIICCVPVDEMAYHCGSVSYPDQILKILGTTYPNNCTIGIEMCHINDAGEFTKETLDSTVWLCQYLCKAYGISTDMIFRHKDIVGWKDCPKWMVDHPDDWIKFKNEIKNEGELTMEEKQLLADLNATVKSLIGEVHGYADRIKTLEDENAKLKEEMIDPTVADWAKEAMVLFADHGIMVGDQSGNLMPKQHVTREVLAVVLDRVMKQMKHSL